MARRQQGYVHIESQMTIDEALIAVEIAADPEWFATCEEAVRTLAKRNDRFTTDDVWDLLDGSGVSTKEPRAMGAVVRKIAAEGVIASTGEYWLSRRPESHRRPMRVWRGTDTTTMRRMSDD